MQEIKSNNSGVYKIENNINKKSYIGFSKNIKNRWRNHKLNLRKNIHKNSLLQNDWNIYGEENFIFSIIESCSQELEELRKKEVYHIEKQNSYIPNGYNIAIGGIGGGSDTLTNHPDRDQIIKKIKKGVQTFIHTSEYKEKMSKATSGEKNGMYGKIRKKRKWINNGETETWETLEKCEDLINNENWKYGRLKIKRIWIHNDKEEKWVKEKEAKEYFDNGWLKGRYILKHLYRLFISPEGIKYNITPKNKNLQTFCNTHDLNYNSIVKLTKQNKSGTHRGWKIIPLTDELEKERNKIF